MRLRMSVIGGGLAGSVAAIAAAQEGAEVRIFEKSRFPRHKVCGEYLTPEVAPLLTSIGAWSQFAAAGPARIHRLALHFPNGEKWCRLPESAFGLSRYRLDELLLHHAVASGAMLDASVGKPAEGERSILAHGRKLTSVRGNRLFGFKAHFEGPPNDAIELFFFDGCYVGISAVEDGLTNVCGLGPEGVLRSKNFEIDELMASFRPLRERIAPLRRRWDWLHVGPLRFENRFRGETGPHLFPAGDALSFVDPFTGSGMLSAMTTGRLAGLSASRGETPDIYLQRCRRLLEKPFRFSSLFRNLLANGWAEKLACLAPGALLVRLTRPSRVVE